MAYRPVPKNRQVIKVWRGLVPCMSALSTAQLMSATGQHDQGANVSGSSAPLSSAAAHRGAVNLIGTEFC